MLLGSDGVPDSDDDGLFIGFELASDDALPDTGIILGQGRYYVRIVNDDQDPTGDPYTDGNRRLVALCRGETPDGGVAEVRVMLAAPDFPAVATRGDLYLPGTPEVLGECGGIHANRVITVSGHPVVSGRVTYSEDVILGGTIYDPDGNVVEPEYAEPVGIPDHDPFDFCGDADYRLEGGKLTVIATDETHTLGKVLGWQYDTPEGTYQLNAKDAEAGKVCARGNVKVTGNLGEPGDPLAITIIATGSVHIGGTPIIEPAKDDKILILAGGDVQMGGNTTAKRSPRYAGLVYAGSQCQVNGTAYLDGHLLCYDDPDPTGATSLTDDNKINGTPTIHYDCSGKSQETLVASWWESRAG